VQLTIAEKRERRETIKSVQAEEGEHSSQRVEIKGGLLGKAVKWTLFDKRKEKPPEKLGLPAKRCTQFGGENRNQDVCRNTKFKREDRSIDHGLFLLVGWEKGGSVTCDGRGTKNVISSGRDKCHGNGSLNGERNFLHT